MAEQENVDLAGGADSVLPTSENMNNENREKELSEYRVSDRRVPPRNEVSEEFVEEFDTSDEEDERENKTKDKTEENALDTDKSDKALDSTKTETKSSDDYAEHITYNDKGIAIYTDPATKYQYEFCKSTNKWIPFEQSESGTSGEKVSETQTPSGENNPYENEHYRYCHEKQEWVLKETVTENEFYKWCNETQKWIPKMTEGTTSVTHDFVDGQHTYTDADGMIFFWDTEKNAWFPKIDDDFMAIYQMNYGFIDNTSESKAEEKPSASQIAAKTNVAAGADANDRKRKGAPEPPKWFEVAPEQNTKVYVSNLPLDITEEEFAELMTKCGMIMKDVETQKLKIKLYRDAEGQPKGDALCNYIRVESVPLALNLLDGYDVRGNKIKVARAEFQMRGEYNPALKPKRKKKDKEKIKKLQDKLFDWRPEKMRGQRAKHERIVIIKNLFDPQQIVENVELLIDLQNDLREECGKCGKVRKVTIFDNHPDGVAQVNMGDAEEAEVVVQLMNHRFFGTRRLLAEVWDGSTKYRIDETDTDATKRLSGWDAYLESDESKPVIETQAAKQIDLAPKVEDDDKEPELQPAPVALEQVEDDLE